MKRTLPILALSAIALTLLLSACTSRTASKEEARVSFIDTVGLAAFQDWKAQNERKDPSEYAGQATQYASNPVTTAPVRRSTTKTRASSGSMNSTSTNTAQVAKKKGWSKAAKGTAIGTAAGAIGGAIINKKNRVLGGVIGGVLGGGIGYGIGRSMDKKDGRY